MTEPPCARSHRDRLNCPRTGYANEQTYNIARTAALGAGYPDTVPGTTVDRQCGSSQQAIHFAAAGLVAGHYDVVVAGGVESMSRITMGLQISVGGSPYAAQGWQEHYAGVFPGQDKASQEIANRWSLSRRRMDEFSAQSHERAAAAQEEGRFDQQLVALDELAADEGIRPGSTPEVLAGLRPAFTEDGSITAGNASQISDGAAALLMMTSDEAERRGLSPIARIHTAVVAANDPILMLTAPLPATVKALKRSGLQLSDIGTFEVNEAFASIPLAWLDEFGADEKLLNPNGGAIALGHPLGASGARIMTTLVHHMRDSGSRYGLQTMCEGGGQANATIVELL